jgi:hypothetical protein
MIALLLKDLLVKKIHLDDVWTIAGVELMIEGLALSLIIRFVIF